MTHFQVALEEMTMYGAENTSLQNLLAILIGPSARGEVTGSISALGIKKISEMTVRELMSYDGIGKVTAERIRCGVALSNQLYKYSKNLGGKINSPAEAFNYLEDIKLENSEILVVLFLNTKCQVISRRTIFKGSLNLSIVHPREIFREALMVCCASIIVAHNHPSGDPSPSDEDKRVTKRLVECGKLMGVEVVDHIIIGNGMFYSLKQEGFI